MKRDRISSAPIVLGMLITLSMFVPLAQSTPSITIGPFTFVGPEAFPDEVTIVEGPSPPIGFYDYLSTDNLHNALTGPSFDTGLANIGYIGEPVIQVTWLYEAIVNGPGPDFVLFDARFSSDPYVVAVELDGGVFSSFIYFPSDAFIDTGVVQAYTFKASTIDAIIAGLPIDLDDYGIPPGGMVSSIRFTSPTEGDAIAVGALNLGYKAIRANIDIDPDTLNLKSKGKWITAYIELPEGYDVNDIDMSTVIINDVIPAAWGDIQGTTLMVKFDRSDVEDLIAAPNESVVLIVAGKLIDGTEFEGSDTIRVIGLDRYTKDFATMAPFHSNGKYKMLEAHRKISKSFSNNDYHLPRFFSTS